MATDFLSYFNQDNTGQKKIDTNSLTVNSNTVQRINFSLADPTNAANIAAVTASNALKVDISATAANGTPVSTNVTQFGGNAVATGIGASGVGIPRVTVSNDSALASTIATGSAVPASGDFVVVRAATANPSNATGGNAVGLMADKVGRLVVTEGHVRDLVAVQSTTISASAAETTIVSAVGAGVFADLTGLVITNSGTAVCTWTLKDSTAGTTRGIFDMSATQGANPLVLTFNPPLPQATANNNWTLTCSTATSTGAHIMAVYVKNT